MKATGIVRRIDDLGRVDILKNKKNCKQGERLPFLKLVATYRIK